MPYPHAGPYLVSGTVRDDHGALTLDAQDVARLGASGPDPQRG